MRLDTGFILFLFNFPSFVLIEDQGREGVSTSKV